MWRGKWCVEEKGVCGGGERYVEVERGVWKRRGVCGGERGGVEEKEGCRREAMWGGERGVLSVWRRRGRNGEPHYIPQAMPILCLNTSTYRHTECGYSEQPYAGESSSSCLEPSHQLGYESTP